MLLSQLVEYIRCIESCIGAQLPGNDLQSLGECLDKELRFAGVCQGILAESLADLKSIHQDYYCR